MIDREQIENWQGGPDGESLAELCAPLSAKKMPRRSLYGSAHQPLDGEDAARATRRRAAQSRSMKNRAKKQP